MLLMLFILIIIIAPLGLLVHELGHVIPALLLKSTRSVITIGSGRQLFQSRLGRLHINVHWFFFHGAHSMNKRDLEFSSKEKLLISMGGPLFNGIVALLLIISPFPMSNTIHIFILFNGYLALVNMLPFCIKGRESDGYSFFQNLKKDVNSTKSI